MNCSICGKEINSDIRIDNEYLCADCAVEILKKRCQHEDND